jgi:hypothetical protein
MDTFLVIRESRVDKRFTSLDAARNYIADAAGHDHVTYQIAQVIATNKSVRVWNEP